MNFIDTPLAGAYVVEPRPIEDERGFFARSSCAGEFEARGMNFRVAQCSISFNNLRGTLRGMHYQDEPQQEVKLVRCTAGAIHDVIVDLRRDSPTYCRWFGVELTAANRKLLYVPEGFAHGFQTLEDNSEVFYQISEMYHPESARGVRWDDPLFGIDWPVANPTLSPRDAAFAHHTS
jgi:dTDP-4-dehydrorhamnose 3,5-epimerase